MKQLAKIVTFSIVPLLVFMLINQSVNLHYHKSDEGVVISHSHPYAKSDNSGEDPYSHHKHTKSQFFILAQLTSGFAPLIIFLAISFVLFASHRSPVRLFFQSFIIQ
ncbi:MAG TPA: hypothetical protein VJ951_13215, partial [Bacteroidales bacterium]|nr:hypothetical protein [Bacteroidales bacterium]